MSEPGLRQLAAIVARDINRTIGGGMPGIELLRRSLQRRGWLDAHQHGVVVAVSRLTPGTNVLAYCAGVGWFLRRGPGALAALLAASVPGALVVVLLSAALVRVDAYPSVQLLLGVGSIVAALLVLATAWHLVKPYLAGSSRFRVIVLIALALALYLAGLTPVRVLLIGAAAGALWPAPATRTNAAATER